MSRSETLSFSFTSGQATWQAVRVALVGVVGSGNLEVLIEPTTDTGCRVDVRTSAVGFGDTWHAVLADVLARAQVGGVVIRINDAGATPAVVALRLQQALAECSGSRAP